MSARVPPFFRALSGFDTTSSIFGKKTFDAWEPFPEITKVFVKLASVQQKNEIYEEDIALLQRYFVVVYIATCNATDVNNCIRISFWKWNVSRKLGNIFCKSMYKQQNVVHVLRKNETN